MLPTPLSGEHPVGQVAPLGDLKGAQDRHVYVSTSDHGEGVGGAEERHPRYHLQELSPGIDQVNIVLPFVRQGAAVEDAALAVIDHSPPFGHVVGDQRRYADAQIDITAVGQLLGYPHSDHVPVQALFVHGTTDSRR